MFQCTCDDDVASYKQILCRWINILDIDEIHKIESDGGPPCSRRYIMMYLIERDLSIEPDDKTVGLSGTHITISKLSRFSASSRSLPNRSVEPLCSFADATQSVIPD
jgi:hypothetical protein